MTASQSPDDASRARNLKDRSSRRISGLVDLLPRHWPEWTGSIWVITGSVLGGVLAVIGFCADMAELSSHKEEVSSDEAATQPAESAAFRQQASSCQEAAFEHLEGARPESAIPQFHCAEDNFEQAIAHGDGLAKVFLARLYSHEDAQHLLGEQSPKGYLTRAGHLWCEAKAEGVFIAQGEPPFETDVTC